MQNDENVFTYKIGGVTITVTEVNQPTERAIEKANARINQAMLHHEIK